MSTYVEEGEYKGYPTLKICYMRDDEERTLISFGVKKAEAIIDHWDDIVAFVDKNGGER